ncbi:hypothetical protein D5S18_19460 [Nocardia panacis]|uniref:Uncharacterized protein n=1 Tax=Nocardia panacis TaxID=2340916 RepID=A0A3A4KGM2_9NOCA|nr:hypothetical protein [Nocardia panacis]RJO73408.1 hypothetical protein D5S18_19460 [Nocardia panacis]
MLTLKLSDAAVKTLGVVAGFAFLEPPDGLADGLRAHLEKGLTHRGNVLTWAGSTATVDRSGSRLFDLTGWECAASVVHLAEHLPIDTGDGITEPDQRILLLHGIALARALTEHVYRLAPRVGVRFIIDANDTDATFRFHRIRPGEEWNLPDLDTYINSKPVVIDIEPFDRTW